MLFLAQVDAAIEEAHELLTNIVEITATLKTGAGVVPDWITVLLKDQLPMLLRSGLNEDGTVLWAAKIISCSNGVAGSIQDQVTVMDVLETEDDAPDDFVVSRQMVIGPWRGVNGFREVRTIQLETCLLSWSSRTQMQTEFELSAGPGRELHSWYTTTLVGLGLLCSQGKGRCCR